MNISANDTVTEKHLNRRAKFLVTNPTVFSYGGNDHIKGLRWNKSKGAWAKTESKIMLALIVE